MSWRATAWVNKLRGITRSEKLLLFVLSDRYNEDEGCARPSIPTIAEEALMSQRTAYRVISALEKKGILEVVDRPGTSNRYTFNDHPTPAKMTGVTPDINVSFPQPTPDSGVTPPLTQLCHPNRKEPIKEEPQLQKVPFSPLAGEAIPQYDFGTFKSFYPDHRMWKNERSAREAWDEIARDPETRREIVEHLSTAIQSSEWTSDAGKYVPNPQKYLRRGDWKHTSPSKFNHSKETGEMHLVYLRITGQKESLCALTDDRRKMLSARWDDALEKAENHTVENAYEVVCAAIEAAAESHEKKNVPKRLTPEAIFETTEKFERWLAEAYQ